VPLLQEYEIPFGACVWATGVAMHPVVRTLSEKIGKDVQVGGHGSVRLCAWLKTDNDVRACEHGWAGQCGKCRCVNRF